MSAHTITPPRGLVAAVRSEVRRARGTRQDADDLLRVWSDVAADRRGRTDRLHYDAQHATCSCLDGGLPDDEGRCEHCAAPLPGLTPNGGRR